MKKTKTTVTIDFRSYKRGSIAASLLGENMGEFVSKAIDDRSGPLLKKHNVKLPADAEPVSQAA